MAYLKAKNRIHSVKKIQMSHSKNILSMINLLFLLAVSVPQVSAYDNPECKVVQKAWNGMGNVFGNYKNSACPEVPGIYLGTNGHLEIDWERYKLNQNFKEVFSSEFFESLPNLRYL
jgi:hypothetical protein